MDTLFNRITPIRYQIGDARYRATGFFYRYAGEDYLITNKHVVQHEHGVSPDFLRIFLKFKLDGDKETRPVKLKLFDDSNEPKWLLHPRKSDVDLAAVPVDVDLSTTETGYFSTKHHVPQNTNLNITGSDIIIMGIPGPIGPGESDRRIIRSGIVSSTFGDPFGGNPCFIVDATMYDGMSGSPVLLRPNSMFDSSDEETFSSDGFPIHLLGIHSGPIDQGNQYGLHRAWYPNLLWDMINVD